MWVSRQPEVGGGLPIKPSKSTISPAFRKADCFHLSVSIPLAQGVSKEDTSTSPVLVSPAGNQTLQVSVSVVTAPSNSPLVLHLKSPPCQLGELMVQSHLAVMPCGFALAITQEVKCNLNPHRILVLLLNHKVAGRNTTLRFA